MTTDDVYLMAQMMEEDGCAHAMSLASILYAISPYFQEKLPEAVNARRMSFDEIIFALYLFVYAAPDLLDDPVAV